MDSPEDLLSQLRMIEFFLKDSEDLGHRLAQMFKVLQTLHDRDLSAERVSVGLDRYADNLVYA